MYIQSPQKILLALARKSLLGKTKHKSRKAGSLGSPALQAGGCSLQLLPDSRGRAAPNTPQQAQGRTENWRRLQQGAGDGRVMAGWRGTGTWMLGTYGPAGKKEEMQHGSWHGRGWEGSLYSKRKTNSQLCDRNICNHPSTTSSCSAPAIPFKAACHAAAS